MKVTQITMERWSGRVALVTGASSGIGAEIVKDLVKHGLKVVGVARRVERVEELAEELKGEPGKLYPLKGDVSKEDEIIKTFDWVKQNLGGVDVLINNAAVLYTIHLSDFDTEQLRQMYQLNVIGLSICTREAIKSMKERGVDDGHIININSTAGHYILPIQGLIGYLSTKHALTALTEGLRRELVQQKSKIRVTSLSPGTTDTEMVRNADLSVQGAGSIDNSPQLKAKDLSDGVIYVLSTPPHVQVHELMIRPLGEIF